MPDRRLCPLRQPQENRLAEHSPRSPRRRDPNGDPPSPYYSAQLVGYNASKAALNLLTVQLGEELRNTPHVVNSVGLGYVKTDLTGAS
jgi:NAD(P)-dependent dehydrogenase (short-subunit alcohol dehydrogenase family)